MRPIINTLIGQLATNPSTMQETLYNSWVGKICWRRDQLPTLVFLGFACGLAGKESPCSVGDLGLIPGLGRSPGEGKGYPLQYSGLENSMNRIVHGVTKSQTLLSNFHFHSLFITSWHLGITAVCWNPYSICPFNMNLSMNCLPGKVSITKTKNAYVLFCFGFIFVSWQILP